MERSPGGGITVESSVTGKESITLSQFKMGYDALKTMIDEGSGGDIDMSAIFNAVYPVGSIYMSMSVTSPQTLFGGTWQKIEGRFLLASDSSYNAGDIGGSNDAVVVAHSHSASTNTAGSHSHSGSTYSSGSHTHTISGGSHSHTASTNSTGNHTHAFTYDMTIDLGNMQRTIQQGNSYPHNYPINATTKSAGAHTHTVTVNTSSSHSHSMTSSGSHTHTLDIDSDGSHSHTVTVNSVGENGAGKNMPAYIAVNVWQRTA